MGIRHCCCVGDGPNSYEVSHHVWVHRVMRPCESEGSGQGQALPLKCADVWAVGTITWQAAAATGWVGDMGVVLAVVQVLH